MQTPAYDAVGSISTRPRPRTRAWGVGSWWLTAPAILACVVGCNFSGYNAATPPSDEPADLNTMGEERRVFERAFAKFKAAVHELRQLDIDYHKVAGADREAMEKRFEELVAQAEEQELACIDAAVIAFSREPSDNGDLLLFLYGSRGMPGVLYREMNDERYDLALKIAQLLIDNLDEPDKVIPDVFNIAGIAALSVHEFELAKQHLEKAKELDALDDTGKQCLGVIDYYLEAWPEELAKRKADKAKGNLPRVVLETNKGDIEIELFEDDAPNTVANFISLVEDDFYDEVTEGDAHQFHRVVARLGAQAGSPNGDATGGPGYTIRDECLGSDIRRHFRGSVTMATAGSDTGGSQFMICFTPQLQLDGLNTVFGRVVRGMDVLARLQRRESRDPMWKQIDPHETNLPRPIPTADVIRRARVTRKRDHDYKPEVVKAPASIQTGTRRDGGDAAADGD